MGRSENDLRATLNLPQTDFPMKANLSKREPEVLSYWEKNEIYKKLCQKNRGGKSFILHDGPPYANGNIHMGHALNKILKDIIVKYRAMNGFYPPYVPGWDCHGLPIELQVDKNLGKEKDKVGVLQRRRLCREYASKYVDIQREEFKRLGVLGDWNRPYLTMDFSYEGATVREFTEFVKKGYVYKGKKPVHWCPSCVTALAEAEVEYAEKDSPSIYVRFKLIDEDAKNLSISGKPIYFIIWTTTPWTLPANLALALNPDVDYSFLDTEEAVYIVSDGLLEGLKERLSLKGEVIKKLKGIELRSLRAEHPFIDRISLVIVGEFVNVSEGTGIVHIAPGHGEDDYEAGIKESLDIYAPVDDHGRFSGTGITEIEGEAVFKANPKIIEMLKVRGALMLEEKITHSYPHCWRCKKPVIFRATEQWFISMSHDNLRERCLSEIENVRWIPQWGKERIYLMVKGRPDWCISRQRSWGVPIAMVRCISCGSYISEPEVLDRFVSLVTEHGADIWFEREEKDLLPPDFKCKNCGSTEFRKEKDILDVWFDSGVSQAAVLRADERLSWPSDIYLEGSDQHRGWFQSSLLASCGIYGRAPYRVVLTHGFVVDGKGKKMSKSLGNVVSPHEIINSHGAEILRLWASAEDYRDDIRISKEIIERIKEAYRKIRNTARFLLGNLYDYDGTEGSPLEIDRFALSRLQRLIEGVRDAYENFDFHKVYHLIHNFCVVEMSAFYLDILKDRLYTFRADSPQRRASQRTLKEILIAITKLIAPVMSFTAEEIWLEMKKMGLVSEESVFLSDFPSIDNTLIDEALEANWQRLISLRDGANKALEIKRAEKFIGNSLEAKIILYLSDEWISFLKGYEDFLPALFIVSQVEIKKEAETPENAYKGEIGAVLVQRAEGQKCLRCWNWSSSVGSFKDAPELCDRCYNSIK